jgi:hypothetical protein
MIVDIYNRSIPTKPPSFVTPGPSTETPRLVAAVGLGDLEWALACGAFELATRSLPAAHIQAASELDPDP